jgi:hypothetical protein
MDAVDLDDTEALAAATQSLAAANDFLAAAETTVERFGDRDAYVEALVESAGSATATAAEAVTANEEAAAAAADAPPAEDSARVVVFNPAAGAVITEGGEVVVESTFTDTGGMKIEVPSDGEAYAEAAAEADQAVAEADDKAAELQQAQVAAQVAAMAAVGDDNSDTQADLEAAQAEVAAAQEAVTEALEAVADANAARQAEAATVVVSADGTQQSIRDAEGNTASAVTSDTGVVITMDQTTLVTALDNLGEGDLQPVLAADGSELVAARSASSGAVELFHGDGSSAANDDGEPYEADDLTAMVLIFALD